MQRLKTTMGKPAVEGTGDTADGVLQERKTLVQRVRVESAGTHQHVRMAVDVLGHTVHNDVGAVIQGVLDVGREEGIVYNNHDSVPVRNRSNSTDIDQAQRGVTGRLNPDQFCLVGADQIFDIQLNRGRECDVDAVRGGDLGEVAMSSAIDVRHRDDMRAGGKGLQDDSGGG